MNGRAHDPSRAFLGTGWAFPLRLAAGGALASVAYEEDIRESIRIILGTRRNERLMRPDFGAGLEDFVFEPVNPTTIAALAKRVEDALIDWEPRIDVDEVVVKSDSALRNRLLIGIDYRVRSTNTHYNLVFPFYLDEGTSE
ncbi:MAG TPA: GPW/gp25 family protein [Thermoanaerobaculia bacterium]|nr:GPW/gp25 family protein [Thermoanaerobaculia bacterium]